MSTPCRAPQCREGYAGTKGLASIQAYVFSNKIPLQNVSFLKPKQRILRCCLSLLEQPIRHVATPIRVLAGIVASCPPLENDSESLTSGPRPTPTDPLAASFLPNNFRVGSPVRQFELVIQDAPSWQVSALQDDGTMSTRFSVPKQCIWVRVVGPASMHHAVRQITIFIAIRRRINGFLQAKERILPSSGVATPLQPHDPRDRHDLTILPGSSCSI